MRIFTIQDETAAGDILQKIALAVAAEMLTVRDLIGERVGQEVARYNCQATNTDSLLVVRYLLVVFACLKGKYYEPNT
jgi:hypothetical protein